MDYKHKYLKYKNKYLALKNQLGGATNAAETVTTKCKIGTYQIPKSRYRRHCYQVTSTN
mgnify:CR=1 FL=1